MEEKVGAEQECDMKRKSTLFAKHMENYHMENILTNSSNMPLGEK